MPVSAIHGGTNSPISGTEFYKNCFFPEFSSYSGWDCEPIDKRSFQLWRIKTEQHSYFFSCGKLSAYSLNDAQSEALAKDKAYTNLLLREAGLCVPQQISYLGIEDLAPCLKAAPSLGLPFVVKPIAGMQGIDVHVLDHLEDLEAKLNAEAKVLESYIEGVEYRAVLLDSMLLFAYQRAPGLRVNNLAQGGSVSCLHTPSATEMYALKRAAHALNLRIVGADYKLNRSGEPCFIELNGHPGLRGIFDFGAKSLAFNSLIAIIKASTPEYLTQTSCVF